MQKLSGIVNGFETIVLADLTHRHNRLLHIASHEKELVFLSKIIPLIDPKIKVLTFEPWDTVPYDRVSPQSDIIARQIDTLTDLLAFPNDKNVLILTTVSALMQRIPIPDFFKNSFMSFQEGDTAFQSILSFLGKNGYTRVDTVIEVGEYAVRGGIIDLFPAGFEKPVRIDFFGDEIDSIKSFDPITQRTNSSLKKIELKPIQLFRFTPESISLFRMKFRELFENAGSQDSLYQAVSDGRYIQGLEHYLPLFHEKLGTLFDYLNSKTAISVDFDFKNAVLSRSEQILEFYQARQEALSDPLEKGGHYYPIPPDTFFMNKEEVIHVLDSKNTYSLSPYLEPDAQDMGSRLGVDFAAERHTDKTDIFESVADFIRQEKRQVIISASSYGAAERLTGLLRERDIFLHSVENWNDALKQAPSVLVAEFEKGFSTKEFILITETDIFGEKIIRPVSKKKKQNFITDLSELQVDDFVVHQIHGVGQFKGLFTLNVGGAQHDCLMLLYADQDKLFVPVENLDMLSRYGTENPVVDKLGSLSFKSRKERVKKDLFAMVEQLMKIAAIREVKAAQKMLAPHGLYQEFCARFPYTETDDQIQVIHEVEDDLASGKPMDRLVCGDVGFGKTEIALRAAFLSAINGGQVAVVVPTTLLARQHALNFMNRFKNFPLKVATLSRLVSPKKAEATLKELEQGSVDIVVGTHALLSKKVRFKNLSLLIVDEEQHFGVSHKERLKELKEGVHVLTLTATPIPRTLQLSLSGVRELSIIATPPVDRLAVKTYVLPFDAVIIKEALLREYFRGGQSFYVCPRISDMAEIKNLLSKLVPDLKVVMAHGQMAAGQLEKIMLDFSDKKYDILLATSIVESGLDIPSVNTIIVHRADMFGLSALYQLRGRVGRGKLRAYAYLTTPAGMRLNETAQKRLTVMQGLDSLGVGFQLASHDLDIRGAGNLLGKEQSGHIKEVGVALYQKMLADAVHALKQKKDPNSIFDSIDLAPQISLGIPVFIPEKYIADLDLRLQLYRRIADLETSEEIEQMRVEFLDRFGQYPIEVENLFQIIDLKILAKKANIERIEVGPKGASIAFYQNTFKNPAGLVDYITSQLGTMKIRPDQKLLVLRPMEKPEERLQMIRKIIAKIAEIAQQ